MGFLTFPREWEGLHEAFPARPAQFDSRGALAPEGPAVFIGAIGGVAWNLSRAVRRKPIGLAVLNGIGVCTIPLTLLGIGFDEWCRRDAKEDVKAILQADNKTLPRRKYIKFTKENTPETNAVICGALAIGGLLVYSRAPNGPKPSILATLGAFSSGAYFGVRLSSKWHTVNDSTSMMKYQVASLKGSRIYSERTGKPPDPFLYDDVPGARRSRIPGQETSPWGFLRGDDVEQDEFEEAIIADEDGVTNIASPFAVPLPPGSEPHMTAKSPDGTKIIAPQRDYEWNAETLEAGLETLQENLETLNKARTKQAQTAEYLWNIIARREADGFAPYARKDSEEVILERKALELLTSIHKQVYAQIAALDWTIANTKKLVLQFQTAGKWLPSSSAQSEIPHEIKDKILNHVRMHKKNLEVQQATFASDENMKRISMADDEKEAIRRALRENIAATAKLIEDLEREVDEG